MDGSCYWSPIRLHPADQPALSHAKKFAAFSPLFQHPLHCSSCSPSSSCSVRTNVLQPVCPLLFPFLCSTRSSGTPDQSYISPSPVTLGICSTSKFASWQQIPQDSGKCSQGGVQAGTFLGSGSKIQMMRQIWHFGKTQGSKEAAHKMLISIELKAQCLPALAREERQLQGPPERPLGNGEKLMATGRGRLVGKDKVAHCHQPRIQGGRIWKWEDARGAGSFRAPWGVKRGALGGDMVVLTPGDLASEPLAPVGPCSYLAWAQV